MKNHITAIIKHPGHKPFYCEIPNTLEAMQQLVEGYIQTYGDFDGNTIICNEEGKLKGLPFNCWFRGEPIMGTFLMVGIDEDGENFSDCTFKINRFINCCGGAI